MYDARAVANFFFDRAANSGTPLTIMTLLKVLYFAHAWYMAKFDKPLIAQPFEAWKLGPVNRVVYDQYKNYGTKPIEKKALSFDPVKAKFIPTPYCFDDITMRFLGNIFDYYSKFHPFVLSDLTHEEDGPWDIIWRQAAKRAVPGMVIPNDLIATWFKERGAVSWTNQERRQTS